VIQEVQPSQPLLTGLLVAQEEEQTAISVLTWKEDVPLTFLQIHWPTCTQAASQVYIKFGLLTILILNQTEQPYQQNIVFCGVCLSKLYRELGVISSMW